MDGIESLLVASEILAEREWRKKGKRCLGPFTFILIIVITKISDADLVRILLNLDPFAACFSQ